MKNIVVILIMLGVLLPLSACGKYGPLEPPSSRDPAYSRPYPPVD